MNSIGSFRKFIAEILAEISRGGCQDMNFAADSRWKLTLCVSLVQVEAFRSNKFIQTSWYDTIGANAMLPVFYWWLQYLYLKTVTTSSEACNFSHRKLCHDHWVFRASRQWVLWTPGCSVKRRRHSPKTLVQSSCHVDFISSFALKPTFCSTSVVSI